MELLDLKSLDIPVEKIKVLQCQNETVKWSFLKQNNCLVCLLSGCKVTFIRSRKQKGLRNNSDERLCEIERKVTLDFANEIVDVFLCGKNQTVAVLTNKGTCHLIQDGFWDKHNVDSSPIITASQFGKSSRQEIDVLEISRIESSTENSVVLSHDNYIVLCCKKQELWEVYVYEITDKVNEIGDFFLPVKTSSCPLICFERFHLHGSLATLFSRKVFCFGLQDGRALWVDLKKLKSSVASLQIICKLNESVVAIRNVGDHLFVFGGNGQVIDVSEQNKELVTTTYFLSTQITSVVATDTGFFTLNNKCLNFNLQSRNSSSYIQKCFLVKGVLSFDFVECGLFIVMELKKLYFVKNSKIENVLDSQSASEEMKSVSLVEYVDRILEVSNKLQTVCKVLGDQSTVIRNVGIAVNVLIASSDVVNKWFPITVQSFKKYDTAGNEKIVIQLQNSSEFDLSCDFWFFKVTVATQIESSRNYVFQLDKDLKAGATYTMNLQMNIHLQSLPIDLNFDLVFHISTESICEVTRLNPVRMDILHFLDDGNVTNLSKIDSYESSSILYEEAHINTTVPSLQKYTTTLSIGNITLEQLLQLSLHQLPSWFTGDKVVVSFLNSQIVFDIRNEQLVFQTNRTDVSLHLKQALCHRISDLAGNIDIVHAPKFKSDLLLTVQQLKQFCNTICLSENSDNNQVLMVYEDLRSIVAGLRIM